VQKGELAKSAGLQLESCYHFKEMKIILTHIVHVRLFVERTIKQYRSDYCSGHLWPTS